MQIDQNQLMTIATWLAVAENEFNITSYEYELMAKLAASSGNMLSANHYMSKYREALEWEASLEAEA
jgi:hypothetical protein